MAVISCLSILSVEVDLASEAIIFVLASEGYACESLENYMNSLGWLCKHRLHWDTHLDVAVIFDLGVVVAANH